MFANRMLVVLLATLACGAASACGSAARQSATPTPAAGRSAAPTPQPTFTASAERGGGDAIGFCAKYGTVDFPSRDARYTGSPLPLQITEILRAQPSGSYARPSDYYVYSAWRCIEGHIYTCVRGPETCGYADPSDQPNGAMATYCREHSQVSYIPDYVVGVPLTSIYWWVCDGGIAKADHKLRPVDAQGFLASSWGRLP
jgi:hypothetical protein